MIFKSLASSHFQIYFPDFLFICKEMSCSNKINLKWLKYLLSLITQPSSTSTRVLVFIDHEVSVHPDPANCLFSLCI